MQAIYPWYVGYEECLKRRLHNGEEGMSCHVFTFAVSYIRVMIIHIASFTLSTRLLPSSNSHVTKFVKLSLRSRQVYDMISILSIMEHHTIQPPQQQQAIDYFTPHPPQSFPLSMA